LTRGKYIEEFERKFVKVDETNYLDIFKAEMFGVVKLVGERLVLEYNRKFGLEYVILRYGPVYGPNERCSCVVYEFKDGLKNKPIVIIWEKRERKNQYTYVEDITEGCVDAINLKKEVFNLISSKVVTIRQLAELLGKKYGFNARYDLTKPEGQNLPYISSEKNQKKLNWKLISLEQGVEKTIETLRTCKSFI